MGNFYHEHRGHHVERARAAHLTRGYAHGGAVDDDAAADKRMVDGAVHKHERRMHKGEPETKLAHGGAAHHRADRPHRAKGGRVKKKAATVVDINVAPQGGAHPVPVPVPIPRPGAAAGPPPAPPPMPPPGAGVMPPGAPPMRPPVPGAPPMPMRAYGGPVEADPKASGKVSRQGSLKPRNTRTRHAGVSGGPMFSPDDARGRPRLKAGPDEHPARGGMTPTGATGIGRGVPVTRRKQSFNAIEAPPLGKAMGPTFSGGAAGAVARREESRRAAKYYKRAWEGSSP